APLLGLLRKRLPSVPKRLHTDDRGRRPVEDLCLRDPSAFPASGGRVVLRENDSVHALSPPRVYRSKDLRRGPHLSVETQFSPREDLFLKFNSRFPVREYSQGHRQIRARSLFLNIRCVKIDHHFPLRELNLAFLDSRADSLLR